MPKTPVISIVVPTYNRPERLRACLAALAALDFPFQEFEIIVVDDSSSSPPTHLVEEFKARLPISLIIQPHAGPATARNRGAAEAQGEFLAFTDDDCAPAANWLAVLMSYLQQTPDRVVGGFTINALKDNPYAMVSQDLIDFLYAKLNTISYQAAFFTSNNMAVARSRFLEIGGFDRHFPFAAAEDRDFCARWLEHGWGLSFAQEAIIYHAHSLALSSFWRQHFNYGRGAFYFHRLRSQRQHSSVRFESLAFYWELLTHPLKITGLNRRSRMALVLLMLISQTANAGGYSLELLIEQKPGNSWE